MGLCFELPGSQGKEQTLVAYVFAIVSYKDKCYFIMTDIFLPLRVENVNLLMIIWSIKIKN